MVGTVAGLLMFVPAALWALALRSFKRESRDDCTEQVSC
jgi:hypothetical protein